MITGVVSVLMWLLVASLLVLRRGRAERNITYAALTIAIAMTLNANAPYQALDSLAGGTNVITLLADSALMVGVFFLGLGVLKASDHQPRAVRIALGRAALVGALVGVVVAFAFVDRGDTTTTFMLDLGQQPAAAIYSIIQFTYYGLVLSAMAVLAARQFRTSSGAQRLPPASLFLGSIFGVMLSVVVITMDVAHVLGNLDLMRAVSVAYEPLHLLTFLLLVLGFAGQPAARTVQARSRERKTRMLIAELNPIWTDAKRARPGISQNEQIVFHTDDPETLLHRQVVEIRDAMIDTRVAFDVSSETRDLVERAERHLLGSGPSATAPVAFRSATGPQQ